MKKIMAGMVLVGLFLMPMLGLTAGAPAPTPVELAAKSLATIESAYQKSVDSVAALQKASDLAAANLDKAGTDLKLAQASGDKEKIKAAQAALLKAQIEARKLAANLADANRLVERLRVILEKARLAAAKVASAKTPEEAKNALKDLQALVSPAMGLQQAVQEVGKPRPPRGPEMGEITVPSTTTSTTQPSPTPVGEIRG